MINQFRKARKQKQMSINELSTRVGVTRQTINNVEKGKCRNLTTLEKIASALNRKLTITLN